MGAVPSRRAAMCLLGQIHASPRQGAKANVQEITQVNGAASLAHRAHRLVLDRVQGLGPPLQLEYQEIGTRARRLSMVMKGTAVRVVARRCGLKDMRLVLAG